MTYTSKIEMFKIIKSNFCSPLAGAPDKEYIMHRGGDWVMIIENSVWVKNTKSPDENEFVLVVYSPAFVRMNVSIFEKIKSF